MTKQFNFFCLLMMLSYGPLTAQNPSYIHFETNDGLSSNEVYDVEIGPQGLLWFTTDRGVCSYDGYTFQPYTTSDGLADNTNFEIYKDSKKRLWFCGFNGRLSLYDHGAFYPYAKNDSLATLLGDLWVGNIIEGDDGDYYFTPYRSEVPGVYKLGLDSFPRYVKNLTESTNLLTLKNSTNTLISINTQGFSFNQSIERRAINPQVARRMDENWIHFASQQVYKSDSKNRRQQYKFEALTTNILIDDKANLWVCTTNGLFLFPKGNIDIAPIPYFKEYHITSIVKDQEMNYWLTTYQNGVLMVPSFEVGTIQNLTNTENRILSTENLEEHIFFGTADGSILGINSSKELVVQKKHPNNINQIRFINKNGSELSSYGFKIKEASDKPILLLKENFRSFRQLLSNGTSLVFEGNGFSIYDSTEKRIINSNSLVSPFVKKLIVGVQNKNEDIWLGSLSGLYKVSQYDYSNIEPILYNKKDTFGRVNDIMFDQYDNLWIATIGNGLFYRTPNHLYQVKKKDGLSSNLINQLYLVKDSMVCLATNQGLTVFNYQFKNGHFRYSQIKNLTTLDGLSSNFINDVNFWKGDIWLATDKGINYFDPEILNRPSPIVPIIINALIVNDSSYALTNELVFSHDQNDLLIDFTGIHFRKESTGRFYRYRLNSSTTPSEWFYSNEKNIRYNDLPPGKYTFEVTAQNKSKQWNPSPAQLSFEIKPNFSQTAWFRIIIGVLTLSLISFIIYNQTQRTKLREQRKRQLQSAELRAREGELAALRNQMNPHFVFNSLNSIQNYIFKQDTEKANYFLSKFSGLMRKSLNYTRLDFISIQEEVDFIRDYLELEAMRFPNKFKYTINVDENLDPEYLLLPSLLLQPIIENAVKHGFKETQSGGLIEIELLEKSTDSIQIYIRDNGFGLENSTVPKANPKQVHKSVGIQIIKNRIDLLNEASYKVKSSVSFINRSSIDATTKGLEVHLILPILLKT